MMKIVDDVEITSYTVVYSPYLSFLIKIDNFLQLSRRFTDSESSTGRSGVHDQKWNGSTDQYMGNGDPTFVKKQAGKSIPAFTHR